ncbi:divergent polysaccharide deacetylase family protein [Shimia thalassica]|uniref:divergent polysaccharide deacetylase family protein n=1 Tax=Shimia thalassica TaxID=1715693 RepID=UPI001C089F62|nr:divergent polysaccharide deacetylase family protein [Shimia thalassica]MBU2941695.1 divergent polysaccharide deacetylase family protein [Shimia thalassica]MDO6503924.1 divergent polysaccharide deacetylase family protein [Shimia thalassica]
MFRGLISGVFWGAIIVVIVVGLASLLAPLPATVTLQTDATEPVAGTESSEGAAMGTGSQADETVPEADLPEVSASADGDQPPLADTESAPQPQISTPGTGMVAPDTGAASSEMSGDAMSDPVLPETQAQVPSAPVGADELSITTNPAQPMAPAVPATEGAFSSSADGVTDEEGMEASQSDSEALLTEEGAFETPDPAPEQDVTPSAEGGEAEMQQAEASADGESMLKPAGNLEETFPQLESSRLPTVSDAGEGADAVEEMAKTRPFDVNAEPFEADPGKPVMSIVLIDDGTANIDVQALGSFPYPLSFAVNTLAPDVADRVAQYRGMGFEVLAMIDLPAGAAAGDVEVALDAHLSAIPEAVGVLEGVADGLQGSKVVSDQTRAVLLGSGHGLVMFPKGLNTAQKLASRDGVPAATVFRDFDGKGQNATVIRRFLDQAAFKAGQEGGVIMVGRVRDETVSALLLWGLQDRANTVSLAPVSTLLRQKEL